MWNKYLQWLNKKKKIRKDDITSITFRDKKYSWHKYYMHIRTAPNSGADYIANTDKDPFLKIFTMGAVNQKSCFTCRYRNQSVADIRLGDYWGERYKNTEDGVSMVLVNTSNGMNLMNQIREQIVLTKQDIVERFGQQHIKSFFIIIAGIITCIIWGFFIRHFRLLKTSKFKVIAQLETKLPEAPFIDEWEDLKSSKKYVDGTDLEQLLPITFSVMYIVAIIIISRGR